MKNLLEAWGSVKESFMGKNIFLFLDYDGTLTPIVERPEDALLSGEVRDVLSLLSVIPFCRIAVISGRSRDDIVRLVDVGRLVYAGNHGLEIRGDEIGYQTFVPEGSRDVIRGVRDILLKASTRLQGVLVEDKGPTLSFHYRMSPESDLDYIKAVFKESIKQQLADKKIRIVEGKKVFEVRPALDWDKGKAVLWLLERGLFGNNKPVVPVYIGDDTTDEDAFKVLAGKGLSVWVGQEQRIKTDYFLKDPGEVFKFLQLVRVLFLKGGSNGRDL